MNIEGMLPFENMVADYVKETDQHVMYRVTPVFEGDNLLAAGVLMEENRLKTTEKAFYSAFLHIMCSRVCQLIMRQEKALRTEQL